MLARAVTPRTLLRSPGTFAVCKPRRAHRTWRRGVGTSAAGRGTTLRGGSSARAMGDDDGAFDGVVDVRFTEQLHDEQGQGEGRQRQGVIGLTLEVPLPPPVGTKLLQRDGEEPVGKALGRLVATIVKARKSGKKGGRGKGNDAAAATPGTAPVTACLLDAATGEEVDEGCRNVDAWRATRVLVVSGTERYRVRVDAPAIASVAAVGHPTVGYPLVGHAAGLQFCTTHDLRWRWFRGRGDGGAAVLVGTDRVYIPAEEDVGSALTVEATALPPPGDDVPCCAPATFTLRRAVVATLPRQAARARAAAMIKTEPASGDAARRSVRVMTYNVLADAYSHTWGALYPYLSPEAADPERRLPMAMEDVRLAAPDVVALQEVDRKWYDTFWLPQMEAAGYSPVGALAEKTGLTREGCAMFCRADRWAVAQTEIVGLKEPGPTPEEEVTAAWVKTQPHLVEALSKISTVAQLAVLEPIEVSDREAEVAPSLVVANTHLFFHPGAVHLRCLQARWLLRHADKLRRRYAQDVAGSRGVGLVICGDFNGEPFDGVIRFVREGRLSAGDGDWALGSVFRWGGTSSRAAAADLIALTPEDEAVRGWAGEGEQKGATRIPSTDDLDSRQQRLGRMAASWRTVSEVERGARQPCNVQPSAPESSTHLLTAQSHARKGCTFKTCAVVAAYTLRRDAGMAPSTSLLGLSRVQYPGVHSAEGEDGEGGGERLGNGPEWCRGDACGDVNACVDEDIPPEVAEVAEAVRREVAMHSSGLQALQDKTAVAEVQALGNDDGATGNDKQWKALSIGPCAMHLRHPLALESACGYPEWTNYVSGFVGALDYIWADTVGCSTAKGGVMAGGLQSVASMSMPPLEAVTAEVALPSSEFPSDHIPMVADLEFVA